ncbi:unnamed protein product [Prunus armeniaca]|uniref:Uncharacterized protein n=1 Tax=Prunus armeniaca TaxID=36596 RepID=A0A6J5VX51_PRUAR|nr:unnamed protein product [Prunus armeniaca]
MFTLKAKVTERLSRIFADSPDSSSSSSLPPSLDHHHPEGCREGAALKTLCLGKYLTSFTCPILGPMAL